MIYIITLGDRKRQCTRRRESLNMDVIRREAARQCEEKVTGMDAKTEFGVCDTDVTRAKLELERICREEGIRIIRSNAIKNGDVLYKARQNIIYIGDQVSPENIKFLTEKLTDF
jgi:hypothetical protein